MFSCRPTQFLAEPSFKKSALKIDQRLFIVPLFFVTMALSSCASEPPTIDPNSPEYAAAVKELSSCFLQQAFLVDDHKSDAETIAQAVQGTCTSQWRRVVALQLQGRAPYVQQLMLQNLQTNGEENGIAINAVLAERSRTD